MKRKALYDYIREEIINELTTVTKTTNSDEIDAISKAEKIPTTTVKKAIDTAKSSGKDVNIAEVDLSVITPFSIVILMILFLDKNPVERVLQNLKASKTDFIYFLNSFGYHVQEDMLDNKFREILDKASKAIGSIKDKISLKELTEMARTANKIKVGDPVKLEMAKKLWSGTWKGNMLDVVEKAGEEGISQIELAYAVGKSSQPAINPSVNEFIKVGAFALSKIAKSEEPEPEPTPEPDEDVEVKDEWDKPTESPEEEKAEKEIEPTAADIKSVEKLVTKVNAQKLSPEDEEKYNRIKKGIETKVKKISKLSKEQMVASDDLKILKALIKRDDIKKLFKAKGIKVQDLVSDIMK